MFVTVQYIGHVLREIEPLKMFWLLHWFILLVSICVFFIEVQKMYILLLKSWHIALSYVFALVIVVLLVALGGCLWKIDYDCLYIYIYICLLNKKLLESLNYRGNSTEFLFHLFLKRMGYDILVLKLMLYII